MSDQENNAYKGLSLLNALIIGFMVGIYEVMGRGGTQAVINMAGQHAGREILRYARAHGTEIRTLGDLRDFLIQHGLTKQIEFNQPGGNIHVRITQCRICPKKVGLYQFDGTACPWGGILTGALEEILGQSFSCTPRLTPGEVCDIELRRVQR